MAREVKILVKNVYAASESRQFVVPETLLVRALKQRIHETFPGAPTVTHQKLIFGGQVCQDTDALEQILSRNQVQSEERVDDDTAAVVFHLVLPRTPTAASAKAEAEEKAARPRSASPRISVDAANAVATQAAPTDRVNVAQNADRANIDSPRPAPIATAAASAPAFDLNDPPASAAAHAQSSAFPAFGQFQGQAATTERNPQQVHQDLYTQGMLMHQQAMILAQIQYLQHVKAHYESISAQSGQTRAAQAQSQMPFHAPFAAPYAHFGMGMHPQMYGMHHAAGVAHPMAPAPATVAPAAPAATTRRNPLIVQIAREILPLFDMRLAMKMAFMLFIIGQDTPNDRVLVLALLSFISYLHICGIFAKIYEVYKRQYAVTAPADAPAGQADGANDANPHDNNGVAAPGAPGGAVTRFDFTRVLRISSDRGLVHDVKYFLVGLVLSLVPAWHPQPTDGGNVVPPMQDLPDAAGEIPVQGI